LCAGGDELNRAREIGLHLVLLSNL
jgi:hypothetical protein